jgi:Kef-type K+ transport system membrane component KefB
MSLSLANLLLSLALILAATHILVFAGKKVKIPGVVMMIVAGLIFNISFLNNIFISQNKEIILTLGNIGLFVLMFLAGLEVSWKEMYKEKEKSAYIAFFACLTPFLLGLIVFSLAGFPLLTAAMIGISMSITAEATKARVLLDLKKLKTRLGSVMMGAGIMDDFIGLALFIAVALLFNSWSNEHLFTLGATACFFLGIFLRRPMRRTGEKNKIEKFLLFLIVPFFFIAMGVHFDFSSLVLNPWLLALMVAVAIAGKILGTFLTKPFTKFRNKQLLLIGWAMNSRGAIELALVLIALNIGLITTEIYSSIIVMALITTLIFPFIITRMIRKDRKIMD